MFDSFVTVAGSTGFEISSIIGTLAFAISGFIMGVKKHLDIMGIFIVSSLPAVGGGIIRDVLVNRLPGTLVDPTNFFLIILAVLIAFLFKMHQRDNIERHFIFVTSDSLGLVAFSITGALVGIEAGLNVFGIVILSFITAVGGGIIRDLLVNDVPMILKQGFYGSVAVLVAFTLFIINYFSDINSFIVLVVFISGFVLRITAYLKKWNLPKINY